MAVAAKGVTLELSASELVSMLIPGVTSGSDCEPNLSSFKLVVRADDVLFLLTIVEVNVAVEDELRATTVVAFAEGYNVEVVLAVANKIDVLVVVSVV